MTPAARVQGAIDMLDSIIIAAQDGGAAADVIATRFFKERRYAGSGDRRAIRALVWQAIRACGERPANGRSAMLALAAHDADLAALFTGADHAPPRIGGKERPATIGALPLWVAGELDPRISGPEAAALLDRAPVDVRFNRAASAQSGLIEAFIADFPGATALRAPLDGVRLSPDAAVSDHAAHQAGAVEVQDAGSQLIAAACPVKPGMTVIDLCAGAGGKTIALGAMMGPIGADHTRLIACDTDRRRLSHLSPRAARAGLNGIDVRLLDPTREMDVLDDLSGKADLVLVDAPCSGSGTWRRNPEARWRLSPARLYKLESEQARLLDIAAKLVRPGGTIVYAVCALTVREGAAQVSDFLTRSRGWTADDLNQNDAFGHGTGVWGRAAGAGIVLTPHHDATDGFFLARMRAP